MRDLINIILIMRLLSLLAINKMIIKRLLNVIAILFLTLLFFSCQEGKNLNNESDDVRQLEYPEAYELANIILAWTEHGKTDVNEVQKGFDYYNKMQEYFKPVSKHPILDSVNYSRERWKDYLSFRTDSYAFEFDKNGQLRRKFNFYTNKGFQPFDDHLDLINDFVQKSKFRAFFKKHQEYRTGLLEEYKKTQYLNEMREFLTDEFGEQFSNNQKYNIVMSPFVGRMNTHRNIDSMITADFITIPDYIVLDTVSVEKKELASSIHMLLTEMDHGYVDPTTIEYDELVTNNFDASLWDNKSGYNKNGGFGVFNEYMTWAVYDIFLKKYFPEFSNELGLYWSFVNDSCGFPYAHLFTQQLLTFYEQKEDDETLKDLYPKMLDWTAKIQKNLSKPEIVIPKDSILVNFSENTKITITFSESMRQNDTITTIFHDGMGSREFIDLTNSDNNLKWTNNGETVEFNFGLPDYSTVCFFQFNVGGTRYPLISEKGVLVKAFKHFKVVDQ